MAVEEIVSLIPARGGSKSIARKNLQSLMGKPLLAHTIKTALECNLIKCVNVSTEDAEIAEVSRHFGAEVPFLRPVSLAQDLTKDGPVIEHFFDWMLKNRGAKPKILVFLRPTNPHRNAAFLDGAIEEFVETKNSCFARSVKPSTETPYKMWNVSEDKVMEPVLGTLEEDLFNNPRQILPQTYWQDGYVDIIRPCYYMSKCPEHKYKITAIHSPQESNVDIDYVEDFIRLDNSISERKFNQIDEERYGS
ncbi:acylneuraminate cytidylyltransferase family protein [Actinobacteria bacterium IMCC26103]|nr:acylneuraminate cytidylyltransferase family protein [Actinobacteria bacterium IMCC26103]